MEYAIYKLLFSQGVHFGEGRLETCAYTFQADRLFSALSFEALGRGEECFAKLLAAAKERRLLLSDAFPFSPEDYFVPRPLTPPVRAMTEQDISGRKILKKLVYLPVSRLQDFVQGKIPPGNIPQPKFALPYLKVSAAIEPGEDAVPYRIGTYNFCEGCGLYVVAAYADKTVLGMLEELLESLSLAGLGGRRSAGLGRFELHHGKVSASLKKHLTGKFPWYMNLAVALPPAEGMATALEGARYSLLRRSGFVASNTFASEPQRKKDSYVFKAGSCFKTKFFGQILDVGRGGNHPVYRYLEPLFMGIG